MASEQLAIPEAKSFERREFSTAQLLSIALENNAAIDVIERLAALREKELARQAELEFNEALNRVQAAIKRIAPDLTNPQTKSKYASYAAIDRVIRPIYTAEGFSLSFSDDETQVPDKLRIVCYVSRSGYTRKYLKNMPIDTKGIKGGDVMTTTHATASADSYAKRYLVRDIFNLATGEDDNDGNGMGMGDLSERLEFIENCRNYDELKKVFGAAYKEAKELNDQNALKAIVAAYEKQKKALQ